MNYYRHAKSILIYACISESVHEMPDISLYMLIDLHD
jgi:hypothetical protein